jgi:hypothetical protein
MTIRIPFVPIEFEITARRRTGPFRVRVRTLLLTVALLAVVLYLLLPFSPTDRRLMATYEQLADNEPKVGLTREQVISRIGPPSSIGPQSPKQCVDYTWVAHFDRPMSHREFALNLAIDPDTDLVAAWGLFKREYQGIDLIWFRLGQLLGN